MTILLSIAVIAYAFWVFKLNKNKLRTNQDRVAKANYAVAGLALILMCVANASPKLYSIVLAAGALGLVHYRQYAIDFFETKVVPFLNK